jgi:hypothetical protein
VRCEWLHTLALNFLSHLSIHAEVLVKDQKEDLQPLHEQCKGVALTTG